MPFGPSAPSFRATAVSVLVVQYLIYTHINLLLFMALVITKLLLVVNISNNAEKGTVPSRSEGGDPPLLNGHPRGSRRYMCSYLLLPIYQVPYMLGIEISLITDFYWLLLYCTKDSNPLTVVYFTNIFYKSVAYLLISFAALRTEVIKTLPLFLSAF